MKWRDIVIARGEIAGRSRPGCGATGHLVWCLRRSAGDTQRFSRRDACCPHRQDACATRVCANDKQMAALELGVGVPMPIEQPRENLCLDLAFLLLVVALLIARVIL